MIQFGVSHFSSDTIFLVLESFFGRSLFWTLGPWFIRRNCPFKRHYRRQKGSNDVFHKFSWKLNCSWCWLVDRVRKGQMSSILFVHIVRNPQNNHQYQKICWILMKWIFGWKKFMISVRFIWNDIYRSLKNSQKLCTFQSSCQRHSTLWKICCHSTS